MISMHTINEPDVLFSLNADRFGDETRGYVVMDGKNYLGHFLFTVEEELVTVQECAVEQTPVIDMGVRACIAAGENAGAKIFNVNLSDEKLATWMRIFCKGDTEPQKIEKIFHSCK